MVSDHMVKCKMFHISVYSFISKHLSTGTVCYEVTAYGAGVYIKS